MFNWNKYNVIASINVKDSLINFFLIKKFLWVPASMVLLITGCNESKLSQCQRLIKSINEGTSLIEKNKGSQVTLSLGLAKDLKDVTKKIERQNFKDPKLQDFKKQSVTQFETFSKNIDSAAKALGSAKTAKVSSGGREQVRKAKKDIEISLKQVSDAAKQTDTLATELNDYCSQAE